MFNSIKGHGKHIKLLPQPTLGMNLEVKMLVIEEVVRRELVTRSYEVSETDRLMIRRLTNENKLTGEEIATKVLKSPRMPF